MNLAVDDLVRVKKYDDIKKTLDDEGCCHNVDFTSGSMKGMCSKLYSIEEVSDFGGIKVYILYRKVYFFVEEWLELVRKGEY